MAEGQDRLRRVPSGLCAWPAAGVCQPLGEKFATTGWEDGRYIKEWVDSVAQGGADVHAFDFPLKFTLTEMCNKSGDEFDMSRLAHAGMIRGFGLPVDNVVTFVDNHDTGKEHDKWIVKDYAMAYAYILTHEGTPCVFYPHFYAVTQHDVDNPSLEVMAPSDLQQAIRQLIDIRRQYLGGTLAVLAEEIAGGDLQSPTKNLYVARRQKGWCYHRAQQPQH